MHTHSNESADAPGRVSRGVPMRFSGVRDMTISIASGLALTLAIIAVSIEPGPTAFTRMLCGANAKAADFVNCMTPPLEAQ